MLESWARRSQARSRIPSSDFLPYAVDKREADQSTCACRPSGRQQVLFAGISAERFQPLDRPTCFRGSPLQMVFASYGSSRRATETGLIKDIGRAIDRQQCQNLNRLLKRKLIGFQHRRPHVRWEDARRGHGVEGSTSSVFGSSSLMIGRCLPCDESPEGYSVTTARLGIVNRLYCAGHWHRICWLFANRRHGRLARWVNPVAFEKCRRR